MFERIYWVVYSWGTHFCHATANNRPQTTMCKFVMLSEMKLFKCSKRTY